MRGQRLRIRYLVAGELAGPDATGYLVAGGGGISDATRTRLVPYGHREDIEFTLGVRGPGTLGAIPMWLIEGGPFPIIVDTAFSNVDDVLHVLSAHGFPIYARRDPVMEPEHVLASVGLDFADVPLVINTHLHFDHYGNNDKFPNARYLVQRDELAWAISPPPYAAFYYPEFADHLLAGRERIWAIDGRYKVCDGVEVVKLGGHSPGSQVVMVQTEIGRCCITGDIMYDYVNAEEMWPVGSYYRLDELEWAYTWIAANSDVILPQHDWKLLTYYPDGVIG
jgi:glyoxylase-like metal-dependent hydrolase (beta-lactamase superfamily II)